MHPWASGKCPSKVLCRMPSTAKTAKDSLVKFATRTTRDPKGLNERRPSRPTTALDIESNQPGRLRELFIAVNGCASVGALAKISHRENLSVGTAA